MEPRPKLFLIDAYAYVFRAYHALPPLATAKGVPTGATYGFITALLKILREHSPDYVGVVWDAPGKGFREAIDANYKANRGETPADLLPQFEQVRRVTDAFCIPHVEATGFEADDVIATLTRQAVESGCDVVIVSGDKDLMQLVSDRVRLLDVMRDKVFDPAAVEEKFGVPPARVADYLSLTGDSSDNVPGVEGIGPKSAAALLLRYGSLDRVLAELDRVEPEKVRHKIEASRANLDLSRKLVALSYDAPVHFDRERMTARSPDAERLRPLLVELEFSRLIPQFAAVSRETRAKAAAGYRAVLDEAALAEMRDVLSRAPRIAFALLTDGHDLAGPTLVGIALAGSEAEAWYVPLGHRYLGSPAQLPATTVLAALRDLLGDPARRKATHDLKKTLHVLSRFGVAIEGPVSDTMIGAYLLNAERASPSVASIAQELLDHTTVPLEEFAGKGAKQLPFEQTSVEPATEWAAEQARVTLLGAGAVEARLDEIPSLARIYREVELPLTRVLVEMERTGIALDVEHLRRLSQEYDREIRDLERAIFEAAGTEFNIASPVQLRQVLFDRLGLPVIKKTKTGPSTDQDVLEKLKPKHPVPNLILHHRSRCKLKSTYVDALPRLLGPDGRLHTTFHQTVAATGRLSSTDPNLQNIPIRTEEGRKIRRAFVAAPGHAFVAADYSQMELRLVAAYSGEKAMIDAFLAGEDIHAATARTVFGKADDDSRRAAKAVNFGILYGQGGWGLAQTLGIEPAEAERYIEAYFERYPKLRAFLDGVLAHADRHGWVETPLGRRRTLPDLHSKNPQLRDAARRMAINHPIQGAAADLMKLAMLAAHRLLAAEGLRARMILQIHDELVFEAPEDEVERVQALAREAMEGVATLAVPLKVDLGVGRDWSEV